MRRELAFNFARYAPQVDSLEQLPDWAQATNILWCFGLHDRPWGEPPIYGMVRSMGRAGMERKTDVAAYIREIEYLERAGKELAT